MGASCSSQQSPTKQELVVFQALDIEETSVVQSTPVENIHSSLNLVIIGQSPSSSSRLSAVDCFNHCLYHTGIPIELRKIIINAYFHIVLTNGTIREAVRYWSVGNPMTATLRYGGHISYWNTTNVTDMFGLFSNTMFNDNIDRWDVANTTNMSEMFAFNSRFNKPLNSWQVDNVTDMCYMFLHASNFNQPLHRWNVNNVINMTEMFSDAHCFNQTLNDWNVSNVRDMSRVFFTASTFNQPLIDWDLRNVWSTSQIFTYARSFNQPLTQEKFEVANNKTLSEKMNTNSWWW